MINRLNLFFEVLPERLQPLALVGDTALCSPNLISGGRYSAFRLYLGK